MTLPKRPMATCVVSDVLNDAIFPSSIEYVVEREEQLSVSRRPVVGIGRDDEDVPVQAQLLPVVLADVRVVPVDARIREGELVREGLADRDRGLRLVRPVVAVVETEAVPVHGRLVITTVRGADDHRRTLQEP